MESQVALTLRLVAGLTSREIARARLVPEPAVVRRITRAETTLAHLARRNGAGPPAGARGHAGSRVVVERVRDAHGPEAEEGRGGMERCASSAGACGPITR